MTLPVSIDKYLIIAHQNGLVEIKGKAVLLTENGFKELDTISDHCLNLMKGSLSVDFDQMAETLSAVYGRKMSQRDTFQLVMLSLVGTEARLLAFLLNERETEYVALTKAVAETLAIMPNNKVEPKDNTIPFTGRKKPKLDS